MAIYATGAEVETLISKKIVIELSDDDENGNVDDSVVTLALDNAEGVVNSFLSAAGYLVPVTLPFPPGTEVVKAATLWLSVCELAARRGVIPQDYQTQCDFYRDLLQKIADGDLALPLPAGAINMPQSTTEGQEPIFTRTKFNTSDGSVRNDDQRGSLDVT